MPPPQIPPKDRSSFLSPSSTSASYINSDLADAVRDSVQIRSTSSASNSNQNSVSSRRSVLVNQDGGTGYTHNNNTSRAPLPPSLDPLVPRRTPSPHIPSAGAFDFSSSSDPSRLSVIDGNNDNVFQPTHSYSHSSPDMSTISGGQPALPSTRMQQITTAEVPRNPFEEDEIEPPPIESGRYRPPQGTGHNPKGSLGLGVEGVGEVPPSRTKFVRAHTG
nr:uncharacterized protein CI109_001744 [Kwoniella shandongensis]KAA5529804.1 hypothetical protein CI109_001744 [Kwoniella shandongensis]